MRARARYRYAIIQTHERQRNMMDEILEATYVPELDVIENKGARVILLNGTQVYVLEPGDKTHLRYVAVQLYLTHGVSQRKIADTFGFTIRTVNDWVAKYRKNGVNALQKDGRGRPEKINKDTLSRIRELRGQGYKITEIARVVKLSVRSITRALNDEKYDQLILPECENNTTGIEAQELEELDPAAEQAPIDPLNRGAERMAAYAGMLEDAKPVFADCSHAEGAGSLLAVALFANTGFLGAVEKIYRTLGPAFYGLRNTFMTLFLMAVLRIRNPEQLNEYNPLKVGRLLGLDRAPAVKTLRRKLKTLADRNQAANLMNLRSKEIMQGEAFPDAVLLVDGHVQCYSGGKKVGKTWSTSKNRVVKGATDYWINQTDGTPLLCIPTTFNQHLNKMLPELIRTAQKSCSERRITVVFDRGGADAACYEMLLKLGVDFVAYHKNPAPIEGDPFVEQPTTINGRNYAYAPYERSCKLEVYRTDAKGARRKTGRSVTLREMIVRRDDGGMTHVITPRSAKDLTAEGACSLLFGRWVQENFFKYMIATYDLDHLYTYRSRSVPESIDHPNPEYVQLQKQRKKIRNRIATLLGKELDNIAANKLDELVRLHQGKKGDELRQLAESLKKIDAALKLTPKRATASDYETLESETRIIGNLVKMTAWEAEGKLAALVRETWKGVNGNERGIVTGFMKTAGSIETTAHELRVTLDHQADPTRTRLLAHVCQTLTARQIRYPGSELKMVFSVAAAGQTKK